MLSEAGGVVAGNGRIAGMLELGAGVDRGYNGNENVYRSGTMMGSSEKEIDEKLQDILDLRISENMYTSPSKRIPAVCL